MADSRAQELTVLLQSAAQGEEAARAALIERVYEDLHRMAARQMGDERQDHTLGSTALVHEAWLRLFGTEDPGFENRRQFFAVAAEAMRRILVEHARRRQADKRGGGRRRETIGDVEDDPELGADDVLAVEEALQRLEKRHPDHTRLIELRFFAGLTLEEIAKVTGASERTLKRQWRFAKAVLQRELDD